MRKTLFIAVIAVLALTVVAAAVNAQSKLEITDVDVKIGSRTDKNLANGSIVREGATPESVIQVSVTVENMFTRAQGITIADIEVRGILEDIDDGDDLEYDAREFDLKPEKDKTVTLEFEVPLKVEEDIYTLLIEVDGRDDNRTIHLTTYHIFIEVEKPRHDVRIYRAEFDEAEITCYGDTALRVRVINLGRDDEDDSVLTIKNSQLRINTRDEFELDADPFDDDNEFTKYIPLSINKTVAPGTYKFDITTYYNTDRLSDHKSVVLTVKPCPEPEPEPEPEPKIVCGDGICTAGKEDCESCPADCGKCEEEEDKDTVVVQPPVQPQQPIIIAPPAKSSGFEGTSMMLLIAGNLIVALAVVTMLVVLIRKK